MNIFEQYGIKEVADVTLYSIHKKQDGSGDVYYVPALYLDTLKVSTAEQAGESVWAQGGQGNARLVNWDYNKTLNISLQDALCSPASLGLCWGGILSSDWKNGHIEFNSASSIKENPVRRISRMESAIYPRSSNNPNDNLVCKLLPQSSKNRAETEQQDFLITSDVVDGVRAQGVGQTLDRNYRWRLVIESRVRSIAQVPDRFFDILGRSYPIDWNSKVSVFNGEAPAYSNFKDAIIYKIGTINERNDLKPYIIFDAFSADSNNSSVEISSLTEYLTKYTENISPTQTESHLVDKDANDCYKVPPSEISNKKSIKDCNYLAIVINNNDDYIAFVGDGDLSQVTWYIPEEGVNVNQFRGLDMWNKFESINEMIYFILTKYEQNIISIETSYREHPEQESTDAAKVDEDYTEMKTYDKSDKERQNDGKLWCYINPRTMTPYLDDYWFHYKEPYYIKSLTIADEDKQLDAKSITVRADVWPGVYMLVGETYIRNRDTGKDEHLQLVIPQAKVKSEQTLTLQADGEPTVFNLNLEVAQPKSKALMEINTYKTELKMHREENGCFTAIDGSSEVVVM